MRAVSLCRPVSSSARDSQLGATAPPRQPPHFGAPPLTRGRHSASRLLKVAEDVEHIETSQVGGAIRSEGDGALDVLRGASRLRLPVSPPEGPPEEPAEPLPELQGSPADWIDSHLGLRDSCETGKGLKVAVLLSGGVDSSLALQLLHSAGHSVKAFYLQIWFQEDFRNFWDACPWEEDLSYARKVCEKLGVELEVVPMTDQYWDQVVKHSVGAIRCGLTPNPDILCNSRVKFGAFLDLLRSREDSSEGSEVFDRVASGHYARLERGGHNSGVGAVKLAMTPDEVKDQTYFLAQLRQEQIARTMFPLGPLTKAEVRQMATAAGLATMGRKDSQGICFLGKVKFSEFVKEHLGEWPGLILEEETNRQLGFHKGFWFHTIGQRSGLLLPDGPWYVVRKDMDMNVVYVSQQYYSEDKIRRQFEVARLNWITGSPPDDSIGPLKCKVRHGPRMYNCRLHIDGAHGEVEIDKNDQGLAAGQYAVFYQNGICLGCGVIQPQRHEHAHST